MSWCADFECPGGHTHERKGGVGEGDVAEGDVDVAVVEIGALARRAFEHNPR